MRYFAPDAVMRFGSEQPIAGSDAIGQKTREVLDAFGLRHALKNTWEPEEGVVIFELDVTYILDEGSEVTVPGAGVGRIEPGCWLEQRLYVDLAPVFARVAEATERSETSVV